MKKLKPNQKVTIYADALTKEDIGEDAILIQKDNELSEPGFIEYWLCAFNNGKIKWVFVQPVLVILFLTISLNSFSQRIYEPNHYRIEAYENNTLAITFSPLMLGLGLYYVNKPLFEFIQPISFISSIEFGHHANSDGSFMQILKINTGLSIIIRNFHLNLSPSLNFAKNQESSINQLTFEIGLMTKVENLYYIISYDYKFYGSTKIGIGLGF
jgi:hypothetical protein